MPSDTTPRALGGVPIEPLEPPPHRPPPLPHVVVTDVRIPFGRLVVLLVKIAFAAIPATLVLLALAALVSRAATSLAGG
jgi:hypothetical protein